MPDPDRRVLFYSLLIIILAVNGILAFGLFRHFVLGQDVKSLHFLLSIFGAEIVSAAILGWRTALHRGRTKRTEDVTQRVKIIQRMDYKESPDDPDVIKKETARSFLVRARQGEVDAATRAQCVRRALEILSTIPPTSQAYLAAVYDSATAYRIIGEFEKSRATYMKARRALDKRRNQLPDHTIEYTRRCADIEMMIGNTWASEGIAAKAREHYLAAWNLDPDDFNRTLNLRDLAIRVGDTAEAEVWDQLLKSRTEYTQLAAHLLPRTKEPPPPNSDQP